jgi:hypothetical protein
VHALATGRLSEKRGSISPQVPCRHSPLLWGTYFVNTLDLQVGRAIRGKINRKMMIVVPIRREHICLDCRNKKLVVRFCN